MPFTHQIQKNKGQLIVIEGLEGAGKSTAIATITELLSKHQIQSKVTREPGGTDIGEILRTLIKNPEYRDVLDARAELLLLYTSRIQLLEQVIKPSLEQGTWVIADRFELSTMAYQGGGRGLDQTMIQQLSLFCLNGFKPDLTLYLDIEPELGMQRAKKRGHFDRIEQEQMTFFHKVHEAYLKQIKENPAIQRINANRSLLEVQQAVRAVMNEFIESWQ